MMSQKTIYWFESLRSFKGYIFIEFNFLLMVLRRVCAAPGGVQSVPDVYIPTTQFLRFELFLYLCYLCLWQRTRLEAPSLCAVSEDNKSYCNVLMLVILGWSYHIWIVCITSNEDDQNYDDNNYWNIVEFLLWNWQSVEVNLFEKVSLSLFLVGD